MCWKKCVRKCIVSIFLFHVGVLRRCWLRKSYWMSVTCIIGCVEMHPTIWGHKLVCYVSVGKFMFWYIIVYFSFLRGDKGDSMKVSYLHQLERLNGGVVVGEISRRFSTNENTLTVGCSYVVDSQTVLKAKLNNHGNLGALLQHELTRKSFLTISSAFETKDLDKSPKFGFTLLLKP